MQKGARRSRALGHRVLVFLVEDTGFIAYFFVFLIAIIGFGITYTILTPFGHGIGQNSTPISDVTLGQGIYFSIVTFSSLGYGDMHPMGSSKIIASMEVLFGLALMGIIIAKVTSRRLSYHVQRLFASDAQNRLEKMAALFNRSKDDLTDRMTELGHVYQSTPGETAEVSKEEVLVKFRTTISALNERSEALREYFSYELEQGSYFIDAPAVAIIRVGDAVDSAFMVLGQVIISLSPQARTETLDRLNKKHISQAVQSQKTVCSLVRQHAKATTMKEIFESIQETCNQVPESYFAVPVHEQPDQGLLSANEPE